MPKNSVLKVLSFSLALCLCFNQRSLAEDFVNSDLMQEIENSLIFDKESRSMVEVYKKNQSLKKSDYVISRGGSSDKSKDEQKGQISIVVSGSKFENLDLREKEKLAYNAVLIGQYEVAIELYKQVLKAEPNNNYSKFSLAVVYQKLGQSKQAKNIYRDLLKANPDNREEIIGNLLSLISEESPKDSIYLLSRLVAQNPNSPYILAQAALSYSKVGKFDESISMMKRALDLDPENLSYKYNLAVISDQASRNEEALALYEDVLEQYSLSDNLGVSLDEIQSRIKDIKAKI